MSWHITSGNCVDCDVTCFRFATAKTLRVPPAALRRELCSFSHLAATPEDAPKAKRFSNLKELRQALEQQGLQFCKVCLEGRKVLPPHSQLLGVVLGVVSCQSHDCLWAC